MDSDHLDPLRAAAAAHPKAWGPRLLLLTECLRLKRGAETGDAARDFLATRPPDDQVQVASNWIFSRLVHPLSATDGVERDLVQADARALLEKLDAVHAESRIRHIRYLLFSKLDDPEGKEAEAVRLMEALEKGDVADRSLAYDLIKTDFPAGPLFDRARDLYIDSLRAPWPLALNRQPIPTFDHPLHQVAQARMKAGDHRGLLRKIRGIDPDLPLGQYGTNLFSLLQAKPDDLAKLGTEALALAATEDKESAAALLAWTGRLLETVGWFMPRQSHLPETTSIYEKMRALRPDAALDGLIRIALHERDFKAAAVLARQRLTGKPGPRLRVVLAHALAESGDASAARAELEKLDLSATEIEPLEALKAADLWEGWQEPRRAIEYLERIVEDGRRPFVRLAILYETVGQPDRALRTMDRAIAEGFEEFFEDPERLFLADALTRHAGPRADPVKLREGLIEGGCGDLVIREWLARKREAPPEGDARRARSAVERLGHESIAEREKASKELTDLGPACASIVAEGLASHDAEVKRRSRALLIRWALAK